MCPICFPICVWIHLFILKFKQIQSCSFSQCIRTTSVSTDIFELLFLAFGRRIAALVKIINILQILIRKNFHDYVLWMEGLFVPGPTLGAIFDFRQPESWTAVNSKTGQWWVFPRACQEWFRSQFLKFTGLRIGVDLQTETQWKSIGTVNEEVKLPTSSLHAWRAYSMTKQGKIHGES